MGYTDGMLALLQQKQKPARPTTLNYSPQDLDISISELLRIIQYCSIGGYNFCPTSGTEDGYRPGL